MCVLLLSCDVKLTGADDEFLFNNGTHLGTACPVETLWLLFVLKFVIVPDGAVLIKLEHLKKKTTKNS